ncbi:M20/M25/M40 family metallo-hydrolase [Pelagibacterium sp. H642]|uniref:M20/M25/M40 family metallo-hydrolase n=1 Tax=Pelagibacterium sp. H642 TaxID=1881069 RepID=UPI002816629B|nr:M20/M25/M40 family metallo-hydrolase [Pelagibacterium sp. H642]WMT92554.1 M20/M25/M40 family metallo-hydrolase [Pelagibacterium sp. H642]
MAQLITKKICEMGLRPEKDLAGNIVVRIAGEDPNAQPWVLAAHMDEIGLVVTHVEADGRLGVSRSGGLEPYKVGERAVEILGDQASIVGIISFGSGHALGTEGGSDWEAARVFTGLSSAALSAAGVRAGSPAVPTLAGRGPWVIGNPDDPWVGAWSLDNRAGVAVLLEVLCTLHEKAIRPRAPLIIAFTVHEEGGGHGAKSLALQERPQAFIAVDGCPWWPGCGFEVNDQPVIWARDRLAQYDHAISMMLIAAAEGATCGWQTAVVPHAYTDASAAYSVGAAPAVGIIGHSRFNSHGTEISKVNAFDNIERTLIELIQAYV